MRTAHLALTTLLLILAACGGGSDFTLVVPKNIALEQGKSFSAKVSVAPSGNFGGTVDLSVQGTLPTGLKVSFDPASTRLVSSILVSADKTVAPGSYPMTVVGTSGSVSKTVDVTIQVSTGPFSADFPTSLAVARGDSVQANLTLTRLTNSTGNVQLSLESAGTGPLPAGITATFTPASLDSKTNVSVVQISVASTVSIGDYAAQIRAVSGASSSVFPFTLKVQTPPNPDFSLEVGSSTVELLSADPKTTTVTVKRVGGFDTTVQLSLEKSDGTPLPAGLKAVFTPTGVDKNTSTSNMQLTVGSGIQNGNYSLQIRGTAGTKSKTIPLSLSVNIQPNFSLGVSTPGLTIRQGKKDTTKVTVSPIAGFTGGVQLQLRSNDGSALPSGVTSTLDGQSVTLTGSQTPVDVSFDVSIGRDVPTGTYLLQLEGRPIANPSEAARVTPLTLVVKPEVDPDFNVLVPSPPQYEDIRDNRFSFDITVLRLGGFADPISITVDGGKDGQGNSTFDNLQAVPSTLSSSQSTSTISFTPKKAGSYTVDITAKSGDLLRTNSMSITVLDFNVGFVGGSSLSVAPGATGTLQATSTNFEGTAGFKLPTTFKVLGKDANGNYVDISQIPEIESVSFSPDNVLPGNASSTLYSRTLSIKVKAGTPNKIINLRLQGDATGKAGVQSRFANFDLEVRNP